MVACETPLNCAASVALYAFPTIDCPSVRYDIACIAAMVNPLSPPVRAQVLPGYSVQEIAHRPAFVRHAIGFNSVERPGFAVGHECATGAVVQIDVLRLDLR